MRARLLVGVSLLWIPLAFLFDGITVLVLPLRLGGDAASLGLVSFVGLAVGAALQPLAGWASDRVRDRIDRRLFLALAVPPALIGLALLVGSTGMAAGVIGYVLVQVAATSVQAAQQTLIPEHVDPTQHGRAAGLKAAFDVGGAFAAFAVLGALLATGDLIPAAVVTGGLLVVAVAVAVLLLPRSLRPAASPLRAPRVPSGLVPLVTARFLFLFGTYAVGRFLVLLVAERLGLPPERAVDEAGGLLALFTVTTALAAVVLGLVADRRPRNDLMMAGSGAAAIGILLLAAPAGLANLVAGGLLMSAGTAAFMTANWAATTDLVPAHAAGRLMAIANLGTGLAAASAGILGPLIDAAGFTPALVIAAAASVAAIGPLVVAMPDLRHPQEHAT